MMLWNKEKIMNNYDIEVKERWGETDAYKEHAEKTAGYTKENGSR